MTEPRVGAAAPSTTQAGDTTWWCEYAWLGVDLVASGVTVTVSDGYITAVATGTPTPPGAHVLTGLTIPGLGNAHSHAFHRALRSHTQRERGTFWTWRDTMYRAAARLDPDSYYALARAVYTEMTLAGITSVGEFHYLHHGPGGIPYADPNEMGHALVRAAADAGIRLTLLDTCYLSSAADGTPLTPGAQQRFGDDSAVGWAQRVDQLATDLDGDPNVLVGAAIHSVRGVPAALMPEVIAWADRHRSPLHVHSSEQVGEVEHSLAVYGRTPTAVLRDVGALGPRTTVVHATHLTASDLLDLKTSTTGVCFCPTTERDLGDGIGPAPELLDGGGLFSLGSDSHAVIDLFEEARAVELDERLARRERGVLGADRLLRAAAVDGHRAVGRQDVGALRVGMRADLVAVDIASIRTAGGGATVENIVFAATAADVTDVVIGGRAVVTDRRHRTVTDAAGELASSIGALLA